MFDSYSYYALLALDPYQFVFVSIYHSYFRLMAIELISQQFHIFADTQQLPTE